jgi:hypothetical protein
MLGIATWLARSTESTAKADMMPQTQSLSKREIKLQKVWLWVFSAILVLPQAVVIYTSL